MSFEISFIIQGNRKSFYVTKEDFDACRYDLLTNPWSGVLCIDDTFINCRSIDQVDFKDYGGQCSRLATPYRGLFNESLSGDKAIDLINAISSRSHT